MERYLVAHCNDGQGVRNRVEPYLRFRPSLLTQFSQGRTDTPSLTQRSRVGASILTRRGPLRQRDRHRRSHGDSSC